MCTGGKEGKERRKEGTLFSQSLREEQQEGYGVSNTQNKNILSHIQKEETVRGKIGKRL